MSIVYDYLKHLLEITFTKYPKNELISLISLIDIAVENSVYDFDRKYQGRYDIGDNYKLVDLLQVEPTAEAIFMYRLEREIYLKDNKNALLPFLASLMSRRTGCELYYSTKIGKGFNVMHGLAIVIGPRYIIGDNFTIYQGVTLGQKNQRCPNEIIEIGNNVSIFANSVVLGNVKMGNNSKLGANSLLICDVEENAVYAGSPAKRIK